MNDILLEALGGLGAVVTAFLYTKWQTKPGLKLKGIESDQASAIPGRSSAKG